jgi:transposase
MTIAIIGIDLGKSVCSIVGLDDAGAVVLRRRMRRQSVIDLGARLPRAVFAMEACCGAHLMGRILAEQGHEVRLMSPEYVQPYVKAQKNDDRDAEAIAEAASRPTMRFVELKSEAQLDMQTLHRVRQRLVGARRTLLNQLRAIPFERGHAIAQGRRKLELAVDAMLADPVAGLSGHTPNMNLRLCPSHSNGNPSSRSSSPNSAGCRQSRIVSTISGASSVSQSGFAGKDGDLAQILQLCFTTPISLYY